MPFLTDYLCPHGHRTEYLHMGSRETLPPTVECEHAVPKLVIQTTAPPEQIKEFRAAYTKIMESLGAEVPVIVDADPDLMMVESATCGLPAEPTIGWAGEPITIVRGNHDYSARERERLQARADAHWRKSGRDDAYDKRKEVMKKYLGT